MPVLSPSGPLHDDHAQDPWQLPPEGPFHSSGGGFFDEPGNRGMAIVVAVFGLALLVFIGMILLGAPEDAGVATDGEQIVEGGAESDLGGNGAAGADATGPTSTPSTATTSPSTTEASTTVAPAEASSTTTPTSGPSTTTPTIPPTSPTSAPPSTTTPTIPTSPPPTSEPPTTAPSTTAPSTTAPPTTAPSTSAPTAPPPSGSVQEQILGLVNTERAAAGCPAVALQGQLNAAAGAHSQDMADNNYFDHTGLDGSKPWDRAQAAGYPSSYIGENIAQGYGSAEAVMNGWMNSSGHRANILNCDFNHMGVGLSSTGNYWTQLFGRA